MCYSISIHCCMSQKSCPLMQSEPLNENGQDFLDIQYVWRNIFHDIYFPFQRPPERLSLIKQSFKLNTYTYRRGYRNPYRRVRDFWNIFFLQIRNKYANFGEKLRTTVCSRSSDPIYIVSYYIKWDTTFWTHSIRIETLE